MKRIFKLLCYATLMGALVMGACTESSADEDQTEQGGSGEKPDPDPDPDPEPGPPDPLEDGKLCILAIGNSFSQDAVEQYLYELFEAAGIEAVIGNMYIGGCSLETHWSHAQSGKGAYAYRKVADGVKREQSNVALTTALADEKWDFVTLQQASGKSGVYSSYNPYLPNLIAYLKGKVDVPVWFHQTWAYMQGSNHAEFPTYGSDQMTMYNAIMSAVQQAMSDNKELAGVIPSGTAIQNARTSFLGDTFNRDGYHLETTYGRYTAACTWFEAFSGKSVVGNAYAPTTIDKTAKEIAQHAAHAAVAKPYAVTVLTDYQKPPVVEGPLTAAVYVDFGGNSSPSPWNTVSAKGAADVTLKDANDTYTSATLSISPAFSDSFGGAGSEPASDIVSGGITWPKSAWADSFVVDGTVGAGDSAPVTVTISGLTATQPLDVTVLATRYNGTRTARTTDFTLTGAAQAGGRIQQGIRLGSGAGQYPAWDDVPFEEYTLTFSGVSPSADGKLQLSVKGVDVGSTVVQGNISAMCIAPAN